MSLLAGSICLLLCAICDKFNYKVAACICAFMAVVFSIMGLIRD